MMLLLTTLASCALAVSGQPTGDEIVLFPSGAPNETDVPAIGPEAREGNDGSGCGANRSMACDHIYNVSRPTLTPFLVSNGTGGAIIIAPGGGYHNLAWSKEGLDVARAFNKMGVSAFVLKYRVPARPSLDGLPKWWAPLQDAQRALSVVRNAAKNWGLDASRIGFGGFSAGGHLSAHISSAWRTRYYRRVDAADDVSCRPDFSLFLYPWMLLADNKPNSTELSPELADVRKDHPVTFIAQNQDDKTALVQGSLQYNLKLLAAGAPYGVTHLYPTGGHGFGLCQGKKAPLQQCCTWTDAARAFLQGIGAAP